MKRSSQVALLLMGVTGVGAGSYALTSPRNCAAPGTPAGISAPGAAGTQALQPCAPGSSSSGSRSSYYGGHWSRPIFGSSTSTATTPSGSAALSGRSSGPSAPGGTIGSTTRGGFGSTGHAMSSSSSSS